ncbi:MAG: hypothetical protein M3T55_11670 [Pseudomonadota bacterium]|nr:hypothetical protein [Pseudomonadota bacterium]
MPSRLKSRIAAASLIALLSAGAAAGQDKTNRQAQLEDLELVRTQYLPKEMAFTPATRALAEQRVRALEARAGTLSPVDMLVDMSEISALADNGHSAAHYHSPGALPPTRLPLRLLWFPDALIIARAEGAAADLAGARVLRIEGRTPDQVYSVAKALRGGEAAFRKSEITELMESGGVMKALGLAKRADRLSFTLRLPTGRVIHRTIAMTAQARQAPTADFARLWAPEPVPQERNWRAALPLEGMPLYLQDADQPFRTIDLPALNARYIQFRSNEDEDGYPIKPFLDRVRAALKAAPRDTLIVDLRFDIGGNILTTLSFMRGLPAEAGGRVYLLVGPYTFSAGIISAAALKKAGGDKVTVAGDEMGDRDHFWSEGGMVTLPNSQLGMRYTDGQWDLDHGCTGKPGCMDRIVDVGVVDLTPRIAAPLTAEAYFARRDPAMDAIVARLTRP